MRHEETPSTRAIIRLNHICHNYAYLKKLAGKAKVMPVIKADAYGHGASAVASCLQRQGADAFAVANPDEASSLRGGGLCGLILVLGITPRDMICDMLEQDVSLTVSSAGQLREIESAAKMRGLRAKIHLKLDSGMNRIGFDIKGLPLTAELEDAARLLSESEHLIPEGVYTHFAAADETGSFTALQFSRFTQAVGALSRCGCSFFLKHACNSAAIFCFPDMRLDMVRPGISLYGCSPDDTNLLPAMEFKTTVIRVQEVGGGEGVGYGLTYIAGGTRKIATIAAGYADGVPRLLSNRGHVLIRGRRVPIAGRVCMDMAMADVTGMEDVSVGDPVTIFGKDGGQRITADDVALLCGTISYEVLCGIGKRVKREYPVD